MRQVQENIVKECGRKKTNHNKFKMFFSEIDSPRMDTRAGNIAKLRPVPAWKGFIQKSPIPILTNLANLLTTRKVNN